MFPDIQIKKILYATDLSEHAKKAFSYAVSLARHYDAVITIFHTVIDSPDIYSGVLSYIDQDKWEAIKKQHVDEARESLIGKKRSGIPIRQVLDIFCEDAKSQFEDRPFETDKVVVTRGNPVEEILRYSKENNIDIIVMGSCGHGGLVDAMIGSTSHRVIRRSKIPVLLVQVENE
ncbi:MAG: universal stress protein [Pseudomonadota bacterium]